MTWQDPMDDTQQTETRRRIRNILRALVSELQSRGLTVYRPDENTLVVKGMRFTATDQLSDTYNDVCYLLTDYNQMIEATLSRIDECADTIEELLEVQVEKMDFRSMVDSVRGIRKNLVQFEEGKMYWGQYASGRKTSIVVNERGQTPDGRYLRVFFSSVPQAGASYDDIYISEYGEEITDEDGVEVITFKSPSGKAVTVYADNRLI